VRRFLLAIWLVWAIYLLFLVVGVDWSRASNTCPPDCVAEYPLTDAAKTELIMLFPTWDGGKFKGVQLEILDGVIYIPAGSDVSSIDNYVAFVICGDSRRSDCNYLAWQVWVKDGKIRTARINFLVPPVEEPFNYLPASR
jgi:hypothetical protein